MQRTVSRFLIVFVAAILAAGSWAAQPTSDVLAATFTVTKTADTSDGACDADCSLREAIAAANANGGGSDTITVPAGTYTLSAGQLPRVTTRIIINGAGRGTGAGSTIIQAGTTPGTAAHRIFEISNGGELDLNLLTVRHGNCQGTCFYGNNNSDLGLGGAIYNAGNLNITETDIIDNTAQQRGGGLYSERGTVKILRSRVDANTATNDGGGIYNNGSGVLEVTDATISGNRGRAGGGIATSGRLTLESSTVANNTGTGDGGGISNGNNLTVNKSSFHGNTGVRGGGIAHGNGTATITNSTIFNNTASSKGGGIWNFDDLSLKNVTVSGNGAPEGGGLHSDPTQHVNSSQKYAVVTIYNTILANSTNGSDCYNFKDGAI